ncbi:MAG TPA: hypothetical protein VM557_07160 [Thermoanaerobaculia bacterium]|nr:hypothetical protein [Thermoanaerobaculia bacterium]
MNAPRAGVILLLSLALSSGLFADTIQIENATVRVGDRFPFTVLLEGDSAEAGSVRIELKNVEIYGPADVSREYRFTPEGSRNVKALTYEARALAPGMGQIGPVRFTIRGVERVVPPIRVRVLPVRSESEIRGEGALARMERSGREPVALEAEIDPMRARIGEQIVVEWVLYARESTTDPALVELPSLDGFWVEEIPTRGSFSTVWKDGREATRTLIRRVALFPMRSGVLEIPPMAVRVGIFGQRGPFSRLPFGSGLLNVIRESEPRQVVVDPLPAGIDLVGDFTMRCSEPRAIGAGPVGFRVTLEGDGNLRSAPPPRLAGSIAGEVTVEEGSLDIDRRGQRIRMTRSWDFVIIPKERKQFTVPAIELVSWSPSLNERVSLRCGASAVTFAANPSPTPHAGGSRSRLGVVGEPRARRWPLMAGGVILIAGLLAWLGVARTQGRAGPLERRILDRANEPARMREELKAMLRERGLDPHGLFRADSALADSYRALSSLIDVLEKEPWEKERSEADLRRRVREIVRRLP